MNLRTVCHSLSALEHWSVARIYGLVLTSHEVANCSIQDLLASRRISKLLRCPAIRLRFIRCLQSYVPKFMDVVKLASARPLGIQLIRYDLTVKDYRPWPGYRDIPSCGGAVLDDWHLSQGAGRHPLRRGRVRTNGKSRSSNTNKGLESKAHRLLLGHLPTAEASWPQCPFAAAICRDVTPLA